MVARQIISVDFRHCCADRGRRKSLGEKMYGVWLVVLAFTLHFLQSIKKVDSRYN